MYHRIAQPQSDVWEICVSPQNFEQHLQVLKKKGNVVSLHQLAGEVNAERLSKNSIAITFDDGYIDNFTTAKPLLEKYGLPATFFISSGNIETDKEFWWDELENIILFTAHLPGNCKMVINGSLVEYDLKDESFLTEVMRQKHISWKACTETSPTTRAELFHTIWQKLQPLPYPDQQRHLQNIRLWAGLNTSARAGYRSMSANEIKQLAAAPNNLFTIGAHTVTHPALAYHDITFQKNELLENKNLLEKITGKPTDMVAYPYGNYNEATWRVAENLHFKGAFTTEEKTIKKHDHKFSLGRFQVKDISGEQFDQQFKRMGKG